MMGKYSDDEELQPPAKQDPRNTKARFVFLFFACLICIGSYFIYNIPASLETQLLSVTPTQTLNIDLVQFNLLYSAYSVPNIIFPIIGGLMIDSFGVRSILFWFSTLVCIGHSIFMIGVISKSFWVAVLGRAIFGCGGETLELAQTTVVIRWFKGKELSMTFGLTSMFALLGSVANDNIEPTIAENFGLLTALLVGLFVCIFSLISTLFVIYLDKSREDLMQVPVVSNFEWRNIFQFEAIFLLLMANTVCMGCSIYCFSYITSGFLQERFGFDSVLAGSIMSISFFVSACLGPFVGVLADKYGRRSVLIMVANGLVLGFHLFWMVCGDDVGVGLIVCAFVMLGVGFAIYVTVFWSSIAYVVKKELVGTAYGLSYSLENIALVVVPIGVGFIKENTERDQGYFWVNFLLGVLAFVGIVNGYVVYLLDLRGERILYERASEELIF